MVNKNWYYKSHQFGYWAAECPNIAYPEKANSLDFQSFVLLNDSLSESDTNNVYTGLTDNEEGQKLTKYLNA